MAMALQLSSVAHAEWSPGGTRIALRPGAVVTSAGGGGVFAATGYPDAFTTVFATLADGSHSPDFGTVGRELTPGMRVIDHNTIAPIQLLADGEGGLFLLAAEQVAYNGHGGFLFPVQYYLHRRTADGGVAPGWNATGVLISEPVLDHTFEVRHLPAMVADGKGGVLVAWLYNLFQIDFSGASLNLQRIDGAGRVLWGSDGITVQTGVGIATLPTLVPDGSGGALVFWGQYDAPRSALTVMGQHVDAAGSARWLSGGIPISSARYLAIDQAAPPDGGWVRAFYAPAIAAVSDCHGGAILGWAGSTGAELDLYSARVTPLGELPWHDDRLLCAAPGHQATLRAVTAHNGGAVFAWRDGRAAPEVQIRAQSFSIEGRRRWRRNGVLVADGPGDREPFDFGADGQGGCYFGWSDSRGDGQVFAQRLLSNGRRERGWTSSGLAVSTFDPSVGTDDVIDVHMTRSTRGSAIVSWSHAARGTLAMRLTRNGPVAAPEVTASAPAVPRASPPAVAATGPLAFALMGTEPNPVTTSATIRFVLPVTGSVTLELLDIAGRRVWSTSTVTLAAGEHAVPLADGRKLPAGVYLLRLSHGVRAATKRVVVLR
jgi:hypothetical protein